MDFPARLNPVSGTRLPHVAQGVTVPKVIYQTFSTNHLPRSIQNNVARIRALNPGWEYRLFCDEEIIDFIKQQYGPRMLGYYNRIHPEYGAARADFFRYLLMYRTGGVYLDIKSNAEMPLDKVIRPDDVYLLSKWKNGPGEKYEGWGASPDLEHVPGGELQQWFIVSVPGHPFLRSVIQRVMNNIDCYRPALHGTGKLGVMRLTGPIAYTLVITPQLSSERYRLVDSENDLGFGYSIFNGESHQEVFKTHYSKLDKPIVSEGLLRTSIGRMRNLIRYYRKRLGLQK